MWLIEIGVARQNPKRNLIISFTTLLLLTLCINNAHTTAITCTNDAGAIWNGDNNKLPNQAPASGDRGIVSNCGGCSATYYFATPPANDLLCHHRRRTGSRFAGNFQNDFTFAQNGCLTRNSSGIIVSENGAAPPVIFLNTATARGPPRSGGQNLYLSDSALNRPAPHFSTSPASLRVPISRFFVTTQRDSSAHPILAGEHGGGLVDCRHFPIKHKQPVQLKEPL